MSKTFGQFRQSDPLITHFHLPEQENLPILYCDMDGVLCNFEAGLEKMFAMPDTRTDLNPMRAAGFDNAKEFKFCPSCGHSLAQ